MLIIKFKHCNSQGRITFAMESSINPFLAILCLCVRESMRDTCRDSQVSVISVLSGHGESYEGYNSIHTRPWRVVNNPHADDHGTSGRMLKLCQLGCTHSFRVRISMMRDVYATFACAQFDRINVLPSSERELGSAKKQLYFLPRRIFS